MNILILNYEYPPLGGGAANATFYLLQELKKHENITIDLVTSSIGSYYKEKSYPNVTIHYLDIGKSGAIHYQSSKELLKYAWKSYWYTKNF